MFYCATSKGLNRWSLPYVWVDSCKKNQLLDSCPVAANDLPLHSSCQENHCSPNLGQIYFCFSAPLDHNYHVVCCACFPKYIAQFCFLSVFTM